MKYFTGQKNARNISILRHIIFK